MNAATSLVQPTQRVALNRLPWVGLLTILTTDVAIVIMRQIAVALLRPDPMFVPLTLTVPIIFTSVAGLGAVIIYAVLGRSVRQPIRLFQRVAAVALAVMFIPDILLLIIRFYPGTTAVNVGVLMAMHVVAWAIIVEMLTRLARYEA